MVTSIFLALSPDTQAWDHHNVITKLALKNHTFIKFYPNFKVTTLDEVLKKMGGPGYNRATWLKELNLNQNAPYDFESHYRIGKNRKYKKAGEETSALEVLTSYADEPDWGMDQNLIFSANQKYLGGYTGPTSQAWRHMYLPKFNIFHPLITFHYPLSALGEAPTRAKIMAEWSKLAFAAGDPYWGFRFLAWSIHYIQDLGQPYHSCLIPSYKLLDFKSLTDKGFSQFVTNSTQRIANYHYLYELFVDYQLVTVDSPSSIGAGFRQALTETSETANKINSSSPEEAALTINKRSAEQGPSVGKVSLVYFGNTYLDPTINIPAHPEDYLEEVQKPKRIPDAVANEFQRVTTEALNRVGLATRSVITWVEEQGYAK